MSEIILLILTPLRSLTHFNMNYIFLLINFSYLIFQIYFIFLFEFYVTVFLKIYYYVGSLLTEARVR